MRTIDGIDGMRACVGEELGVSDWYTIEQAEIDAFATATGDHYWLHVETERAAASPYGSTIAHGLLTLGLGPKFSYEIYEITGLPSYLNYGFGRVRWPAPVPVGSRVRMRARLDSVTDVPGGGVTCTITQTFEREGGDRPVCVAESLIRLVAG